MLLHLESGNETVDRVPWSNDGTCRNFYIEKGVEMPQVRTSDVVLMSAGPRVRLIHMPVFGERGDLAIVQFDGHGILFAEQRSLEARFIAHSGPLSRCRTANGVASVIVGKRLR